MQLTLLFLLQDLSQLIHDLHAVNERAGVSVKLVSSIGIGTVACGVAKADADVIQISGGDGGTGASPLSSIKHAGCPWELGLTEAHSALLNNKLRDRVTLRVDGGVRTGRDVAIASTPLVLCFNVHCVGNRMEIEFCFIYPIATFFRHFLHFFLNF